MLKIMKSVAESKLGYSYGKPLRVDEKALTVVLPILRETSLHRQYITFPETEKVNVFDLCKIDQMEADNQSGENVFIRSGTLFTGATQSRALQRSVVLFPNRKQILEVRCVHRSRGISGNTKVKYGGITPLDVEKGVYGDGYKPLDQATYWSNVSTSNMKMDQKMGKVHKPSPHAQGIHDILSRRACTARDDTAYYSSFVQDCSSGPIIGSASGSWHANDDLHTTFNQFASQFESVLSKVKLMENQAGIALINQSGVETIEFFDHNLSWKALHESAVKRLGSNITDQGDESVFEYKPENAIKAVNRVLGLDFKTNNIFRHRPSNGEPEIEITGLTADNYVGEAVELNGSLIHLVLLKKA